MSSSGEIAGNTLVLTFIGSIFCGVVICSSRLLKKCYDKYVLNLSDEQEAPMNPFQNAQGRYAKANIVVLSQMEPNPDVLNFAEVIGFTDFVESRVDDGETYTVAVVV